MVLIMTTMYKWPHWGLGKVLKLKQLGHIDNLILTDSEAKVETV